MRTLTGLALAAASVALAACDGVEMTEMSEPVRTGTSSAETACVAAVNTNMGRGGATVTTSEFSEAGTLVMVRSDDGTNWRCLASNSGVVADLSIT